jgi:hypothetical protein
MTGDLSAFIPGLGLISADSGLIPLDACSDGRFQAGRDDEYPKEFRHQPARFHLGQHKRFQCKETPFGIFECDST